MQLRNKGERLLFTQATLHRRCKRNAQSPNLLKSNEPLLCHGMVNPTKQGKSNHENAILFSNKIAYVLHAKSSYFCYFIMHVRMHQNKYQVDNVTILTQLHIFLLNCKGIVKHLTDSRRFTCSLAQEIYIYILHFGS